MKFRISPLVLFFFVLLPLPSCKTLNNQFRDVKFECGEDAMLDRQYVKISSPRGEDINPRVVSVTRTFADQDGNNEELSVTSKGCVSFSRDEVLQITAKGEGYTWGIVSQPSTVSGSIKLKDIAKWNPSIVCPIDSITNSNVEIPLDWDKSILEVLPVDIYLKQKGEIKIQERWVRPSIDLSFNASDGPFELIYRWQDPFDNSNWREKSCAYSMDRSMPVVVDSLPEIRVGSDFQIQSGQIITLKTNDNHPEKMEYCFHKRGEDCSFTSSTIETSFYAPDQGYWCLKYRATDRAGNQSAVIDKCGISMDFNRINEIKTLLNASSAKDPVNPFLSVVYIAEAFSKFWKLATSEEKALVDEELLGATWNLALNNKIIGQSISEFSWQIVEVGEVWAKRSIDRIIFRNLVGKKLGEFMLGESDNIVESPISAQNRVAVPTKAGVELFEASEEHIKQTTILTPMSVFRAHLSPRANYVIATGDDLAILYDLSDFSKPKEIWRINVEAPYQDVFWSYDSDFFGFNDKHVRVFRMSQAKSVEEIKGFEAIERAFLIIGGGENASLVYRAPRQITAKNLISKAELRVTDFLDDVNEYAPISMELISADEFAFFTTSPSIVNFDPEKNDFSMVTTETGLKSSEVETIRWHPSDRIISIKTKTKIFLFNANKKLNQQSYLESYSIDSFDVNPGDRTTEYGHRYFHINGITGVESNGVVKYWAYQPLVGKLFRSDLEVSRPYPTSQDIRPNIQYPNYLVGDLPIWGERSKNDYKTYDIRSFENGSYILPRGDGSVEVLIEGKWYAWNDEEFEVIRTFFDGLIVRNKSGSNFEYWKTRGKGFEKFCELNECLGVDGNDFKEIQFSPDLSQFALIDKDLNLYILRKVAGKFESIFHKTGNRMASSVAWDYEKRRIIISPDIEGAGILLYFDSDFRKILRTEEFESNFMYSFDRAPQGGYWGWSYGFSRLDENFKQRFTINVNIPGMSKSIGYIPENAKSIGISLVLSNANNVVVPMDFQLPIDLKQNYKELCEKIKPSLELDDLIPEAKAIIDNFEGLCRPIP